MAVISTKGRSSKKTSDQDELQTPITTAVSKNTSSSCQSRILNLKHIVFRTVSIIARNCLSKKSLNNLCTNLTQNFLHFHAFLWSYQHFLYSLIHTFTISYTPNKPGKSRIQKHDNLRRGWGRKKKRVFLSIKIPEHPKLVHHGSLIENI